MLVLCGHHRRAAEESLAEIQAGHPEWEQEVKVPLLERAVFWKARACHLGQRLSHHMRLYNVYFNKLSGDSQ